MRLFKTMPGVSALALLMAATTAHAQQPQQTDDAAAASEGDEIVVTGTSIRGVAPAGAPVIGLDETAVRATGASSTAQVLATIPQLSEFGEVPTIQGSNNYRLAVNRPNLRNLPGGVSSTSSTLVLMDGHRLVGSGVVQTFADPDVIPPSVLQRVEVVPDGGSAVYGADAVGGVINFITRRDFDGLQVDYRHSFGDGFEGDDGSITAGRTWDGGSAFVSYAYSHRDPLYANDRDYVRNINWATGLPTENRCATPNTTLGGAPVGTTVVCDPSRGQFNTLFGEETRNSVFGGYSQDLTESLTFDLRAWYTNREAFTDGGARRATVLTPPITGVPATQTRALFDFSPFNPHSPSTSDLETYGFSPSVTWDIGSDWQMRAFANHGHSDAEIHAAGVNTTLLQSYVTAGLIDPYNIAAPANASRVAEVLNTQEVYGRGIDEIWNSRVVFDGPLMPLPGGDVRLAIGAEYLFERFSVSTIDTYLIGGPTPASKDQRRAMAYFGELNIPIVGEDNSVPLINALSLSLAARLDDYSDFGQVATPRIGLRYEITDWFTLRGTWGEAFQAPGLADTARASSTYTPFTSIPSTVLVRPGDTVPSNWNILSVTGSVQGLQPQEATTWTAGFDISPPIIPGLEIGATYYNIDYQGRISNPTGSIATLFQDFPDLVLFNPAGLTPAQIAPFLAENPGAANALGVLATDGDPIYLILDSRNRNLGNEVLEGFDYSISYTRDVPFGTIYGSVNGTYLLDYRQSTSPTAPLSNNRSNLDNNTRSNVSATIGMTVGEHWLAQATLNHAEGVKLTAPQGLATPTTSDDQTDLDNFDVVNLFVQYDFLGEGLTEDLRLSLGVNNMFDQDPPIYRGTWPGAFSQTGFAQTTLGRVIQVGVSKRF